MTLSYSEEKVKSFKPEKSIEWSVDRVILWSGEDETDGINIDLPLGKNAFNLAVCNLFYKFAIEL